MDCPKKADYSMVYPKKLIIAGLQDTPPRTDTNPCWGATVCYAQPPIRSRIERRGVFARRDNSPPRAQPRIRGRICAPGEQSTTGAATNSRAYLRAGGTIHHGRSHQSAGVFARRENNLPRAQPPIRGFFMLRNLYIIKVSGGFRPAGLLRGGGAPTTP